MSKWVGKGVYNAIFDNVEDSLSLSRVQCFDFAGVNNEQYADLIEPLMVWLLRRINDVLYEPANLGVPKHILIEEIFSSMKNRQLLEGALASIKTVRKNLHKHRAILAPVPGKICLLIAFKIKLPGHDAPGSMRLLYSGANLLPSPLDQLRFAHINGNNMAAELPLLLHAELLSHSKKAKCLQNGVDRPSEGLADASMSRLGAAIRQLEGRSPSESGGCAQRLRRHPLR